MLVSLKWLSRYIDIPVSHEDLALRLSLSGLNHEETTEIYDDVVVDLEVTSNRGDCLGHLGVAREIGVLYGVDVTTPQPTLAPSGVSIESLLSVENQFPAACPRYTARVIQGVRVGPSPQWLIESLRSVFWKRRVDGTIDDYQSVNNVVDATNFVMMECGQPLHAFDLAKVAGGRIVVRPAGKGETIEAIDHKTYPLDPSMCVIADASDPQAVAGVMGGAASEVTESTTDLVIEAAVFTPLSVRRTARTLKLHSPSSYRFERKVDPVGVEWASRRVCEIITEIAGGKVADGIIDTAPELPIHAPVVLRGDQIERILGIRIDADEVQRILTRLGCEATAKSKDATTYVAPSWRHDLTREADLIEEVARIHGYDKIPEDAPIPVAPSSKRQFDVAMERVRHVMTAAGISEAMTPSIVTEKLDAAISPWTDAPALQTETPMLKGARRLRRSLIPSLIEGRARNWASASIAADLFEIAHVYLPSESSDGDETLPSELYCLGLVSGKDFFVVKGVIEALCHAMGIDQHIAVERIDRAGFAKGGGVSLLIEGDHLGYLGVIDPKLQKSWKLPDPVVVAELSLPMLIQRSTLVPQQKSVSMFPSVERDLNFIVRETVRWVDLENVVRAAVGNSLADVTYRETYRDPNRDGPNRKRVLLSVQLQRHDETLSGDQADELIGKVIAGCKKELDAVLVS
jgi:phenylalanyl-tRNA synthetase beta chain